MSADMDELIDLERQGWQALSSGGGTVVAFYRDVLHDDVLMLFPHGMRIEGKERVLASMSGPPWTSFRLEDLQTASLARQVALVTYRAAAVREATHYEALVSSIYVRVAGGWKLRMHQQTPL